jgi:hypothetical protein
VRLEGSHFIILQLYRLAAGGSQERLHVMQLYRLSHSHCNGTDTMGKTSRWVVPGSRLFSLVLAGLALSRMLRGGRDSHQSGSPPGVGRWHAPSPKPIEDEDEND